MTLFLLFIPDIKYLNGSEQYFLSVDVTSVTVSKYSTIIQYKNKTFDTQEALQLMETVPGLNILPLGGKTDSTIISLTGLSGKQISITVNGMSYETPSGDINLDAIPGEIRSVTVIPTAGNLEGEGQTGVISLKTIDNGCSDSIVLELGSENYKRIDLNLCYRVLEKKYNFFIGKTESAGKYKFVNNNGTFQDKNDDYIDTRKNNFYDKIIFSANYDDNETKIILNLSAVKKGDPGLITFPAVKAHSDNKHIQAVISKHFINHILFFGLINDIENFYDPGGEFTGKPQYINYKFIQIEQRSENSVKLNSYFKDMYNIKLKEYYLTGSYYLLRKRILFNFSNTLNVIYKKIIGLFSLIVKKSNDIYLPQYGLHGGIKYELSNKISLGGNLNRHFRLPTMQELYYNHGYISGNNNLTTEHGYSGDLFLENSSNPNITIRIYEDKIYNMIDYYLVSGFRFKPLNLGYVEKKGVDLTFSVNINNLIFFKNAFSYFSGFYSKNNLNGRLPNYPRWKIFSEISYGDRYKINLFYKIEKDIFLNLSNTKKIDLQQKVDISFEAKMKNYTILFQITNILNNEFYTFRYYPTPLREYSLKIISKF